MERQRSRFTPPSSRAVLVVGGLGFAWLALAGLFVLHLEAGAASGEPPHQVTPAVQAVQPVAPALPLRALDRPARARPSAFDSASDEPLAEELATLLKLVHFDLGEHGEWTDATLRVYARTVAARMNAHGETLIATFSAPDVRTARRRAARAHALLVEAGVRPWFFEAVGERGPDAVTVEPG